MFCQAISLQRLCSLTVSAGLRASKETISSTVTRHAIRAESRVRCSGYVMHRLLVGWYAIVRWSICPRCICTTRKQSHEARVKPLEMLSPRPATSSYSPSTFCEVFLACTILACLDVKFMVAPTVAIGGMYEPIGAILKK